MIVAVADLGGTRTKFGLVEDGTIIATGKCEAEAGGPIAAHLDRIAENLSALCTERGFKLSNCRGVGLLSTGIVDNRNMRVISTNGKYDDATELDFSGWAMRKTGLELRMDNDARGAMIGEWRFGAAAGCRNAVMMTIGTGIGTAVILNGQPLVGPHFTAGLLGGHIIVNSGGASCTCGATGCLEAEAGGWALPGIVRTHPGFSASSLAGETRIDFQSLFLHAQSGDKTASAVRDRCLQLWGEAAVSYIHLYDPEKIIIGGGVMNPYDPQKVKLSPGMPDKPGLVLEHIRAVVEQMAWAGSNQVEIVAAMHPDNAGLYGAAALFCER